MSTHARTLSITTDLHGLDDVRGFVERAAIELGADPERATDMLVAVNELVTNIVVHGYGGRPGPIDLLIAPLGADLLVRLGDRAPRFDPTRVPAPRTDLPLELRPPGGMGIHLARHFTDELRYRPRDGGGNELTLVKRGLLGSSPGEERDGADG
ncbi:MAG: ATP-binding protein [Chloroflexi bacterium OHK40]